MRRGFCGSYYGIGHEACHAAESLPHSAVLRHDAVLTTSVPVKGRDRDAIEGKPYRAQRPKPMAPEGAGCRQRMLAMGLASRLARNTM